MKRRILCAFILGFVTASAVGNLVFNPSRPAWESVVSLAFVAYFMWVILKER